MRGDERCLSLCPAFAGRDCHPVRAPGPPVAPAKAGAVSEVILPMTPAGPPGLDDLSQESGEILRAETVPCRSAPVGATAPIN